MEKESSQSDFSTLFQTIFWSKNCQFFYKWVSKNQFSLLHFRNGYLRKWPFNWLNLRLINWSFKSTFQSISSHINSKTNKIDKQLISVTLNVLFDFRSSSEPDQDRGHMKFSSQRYQSILAQLEKMECDIITLNEVTRAFVKIIEETEWVRKSYKISTVHDSTNSIKRFGNIILTKLNPLALHILKVPNLPRPIPIAFFLLECQTQRKSTSSKVKTKLITFSSIHLTAYDTNFKRRERQLTFIKEYLDSLNRFVDQHILQGDMNFHSENENVLARNLGLQDCWLKINKIQNEKDIQKNPGYTFDSTANYFTKELYWGFQKRKMRLDRIFYSLNKEITLNLQQMKIIFNKPIYQQSAQEPNFNIFKSGICFLADRMKVNMFRNKEKYLFCSDHFGLLCKFKFYN